MNLSEYDQTNNAGRLLLEWDTQANGELTPRDVRSASKEKVSWVCGRGHRWKASVAARTMQGQGCPYCAGQRVLPGENDLLTLRPEIAALWDTERNELTPSDVKPSSHKPVWWRCRSGHSWRQRVYVVSDGCGCPYCAGHLPIVGVNDLATTHPALAAEWDAEKNGAEASSVSAGSALAAWWRCPEGHSYQSRVFTRGGAGASGCPYCSGKKVLAGFNDLLTTDPELCLEWDAERNALRPTQVNRGSHRRIWWRCGLGHSYDAPVYSRIAGNGCPYCAGRKALAGFNDLATTHPAIAAQWDAELNGELTPQMVTKGSNRKVWFRCGDGHVWRAAVFSRTRKRGSGCPICARQVRIRCGERYRPDGAALGRRIPAPIKPDRQRPAGGVAV